MNVKIRNEIQALIRIQERNNNGGELREFICARKVDDCGEKTYLSTWIYGSTSWTGNTSAHQTLKPVKCGSVSGAITG